jgi:integrase/recombinase XerD
MSSLDKSVEDYLAMRRALGFTLDVPAYLLRQFASFFKAKGASRITTDLALRWAKQPVGVQPARWARRLSVVRRFAQFVSTSDPGTETAARRTQPPITHRAARGNLLDFDRPARGERSSH